MEDFRRDCNITDSSSAETESIVESPRWILATKKEAYVRGGPPESIVVDADLANKSMPHQKEGVEFIWRNCFADWDKSSDGNDAAGGCIVAHEMGLGKSFTTITLLHTVMNNLCLPESERSEKRRCVRRVLLLAPANVIRNWENEIKEWTNELEHKLPLINLQRSQSGYREDDAENWEKSGGVLLMSDKLFCKQFSSRIIKEATPDILVLDEAHTMLKNATTKISKILRKIPTKRIILLTGTPMQNNATEFYQLVNFVRPGVIPGVSSDAAFEAEYRKPIEAGLPQDATDKCKQRSEEIQLRLNKIVEPFLDRKTKKVIEEKLPDFFDTLLILQQGVTQQHILLGYEKYREVSGDNSFLRRCHLLSPVLNHPAALKIKANPAKKKSKCGSMESGGQEASDSSESNLAKKVLASLDENIRNKLHETRNSPKIIILAHILAMAFREGEKVLVYAKCLTTLDLISNFLELKDWKKQVGSLATSFPLDKLGGLRKGKDYVRIEGKTESGKRGAIVEKFNKSDSISVFLISSVAGGIGINLTSASRVVMMDNHFNPSISDQCVARAHRLGQQKAVHCYRLAIEGTLETKVFARGVNKAGMASGVIEGNPSKGRYDRSQLENLVKTELKVTCCLCGKKRLLTLNHDQDPPGDDEKWDCSQNGEDSMYNNCSIPADDIKSSSDGKCIQDFTLKHLAGLINPRTRKTPLVVTWEPVLKSTALDKKRERREGKASGSHSKRQK